MTNIAYFISSHGFGHAARSAAVIASLYSQKEDLHFEIFTITPRWFFDESLPSCYHLQQIKTDVGLVQTTPMSQDLTATVTQLNQFLSFPNNQIEKIADQLMQLNIDLVICDISPLGILAAQQAGIPSVLIENFTWDWIYEDYLSEYPDFYPIIQTLKGIYRQSSYHIQTQPLCDPTPNADFLAAPASRHPRQSSAQIRNRLEIPEHAKMVLITMGGIPEDYSYLNPIVLDPEIFVVIPGGSDKVKRHENTILLPHHSDFYHPDLVHSANAIIGKAGYSTIAETYLADLPFGYILRSNFRESELLGSYITKELRGFKIDESDFKSQDWVNYIPALLGMETQNNHRRPNGANQIADYILSILGNIRQ